MTSITVAPEKKPLFSKLGVSFQRNLFFLVYSLEETNASVGVRN